MSKFIQALFAFVTALWRKGKDFCESYSANAVEFVERFKKIIDNPTADVIAAIIPGIVDDKALAWLRKVLPGIIEALGIPFEIKDANNIVEWIQALAKHLASLPKPARRGLFRDIATMIALERAKLENYKHINDITVERANLLTEMAYLKIKDVDIDA
jgi:hypothetical protein